MAGYAPNNSLAYLESNSLPDVLEQVSQTEAWKALVPAIGLKPEIWPNNLLTKIMGLTGIGPVRHVLLARSQVAVVVLELGSSEEGEILNVTPAAALLVETHSSASRIRPIVEEILREFVPRIYQNAEFRTRIHDDVEILEWNAPVSNRQILSAIDGSLIIIANDEATLWSCLAVRRGHQRSLSQNEELKQIRERLQAENALAFGFVPKSSGPQLLTQIGPLLVGMGSGDMQVERVLATSASKLIAGFGWSSHANDGGIEDRYLCILNPDFASRLRIPLAAARTNANVWSVLPTEVHSITFYNYQDPGVVWANIETALSTQLDALSAILVNSIIKASLIEYGIRDPHQFLRHVQPELLTARLSPIGERSLLIARVRDKNMIGESLLLETGPVSTQDISTAFAGEYILLGSSGDVAQCLKAFNEKANISNGGKLSQIAHYSQEPQLAGVVTYTDESQRIRNFIQAVAVISGTQPLSIKTQDLESKIAQLPFSATETTIGEPGIERRTRSSFGQFSNLLPLLMPYSSDVTPQIGSVRNQEGL